MGLIALTVTEDVTAVLGVVGQISTQIFTTVGELATLVMSQGLLLIPVSILIVYTGIKVFKWIF